MLALASPRAIRKTVSIVVPIAKSFFTVTPDLAPIGPLGDFRFAPRRCLRGPFPHLLRPAGERTSVESIQRVNRCVWSLRSARKLYGFALRRPPPERPGPPSARTLGQPRALGAS